MVKERPFMQAIHSSNVHAQLNKNIDRRFTNSIFLLLLYRFPHFDYKLKFLQCCNFFLQSLINHPSILTILWENEKNYYWRIRRWIGYYFKDIFNPRIIKLFTDYIQEQHDIKAKLSELSPFFSSLQNPKLYMYNSKHSPYFPFTFQAHILCPIHWIVCVLAY